MTLLCEYVFHVFQNSCRIGSICIQRGTRGTRVPTVYNNTVYALVRGAHRKPACAQLSTLQLNWGCSYAAPTLGASSTPPLPPPRLPHILRSSSSELSESESREIFSNMLLCVCMRASRVAELYSEAGHRGWL